MKGQLKYLTDIQSELDKVRQDSEYTTNRLHSVFEDSPDQEAFLLLDDKMLTDLKYI